jgi:hypothetical protein
MFSLNKLNKYICEIGLSHWLCASYVKRVRKNREEQVSGKCLWCGRYRMSRTHVGLRSMHPNLDGARKDIWDRPDEAGRMRKRPTSLDQLLGKWETPLPDRITATGVDLVGQEMVDKEDERVERMMGGDGSHFFKNNGWKIIPGSQQPEVENVHFIAVLFLICCVY